MPEDVQLETPQARITSSATSSNALRRRASAKGASASPQASGRAFHVSGVEGLIEAVVSPVAICTTTFPVVLAGIPSLAGLKVHAAYGGSEEQLKLKTPWEPLSGVISSL